MKYSDALYDTSVFIGYDLPRPAGWLSSVVLQELVAGANGRTDIQRLALLRRDYEARGRLLLPDNEAWWTAGRILNHILGDLSRKAQGRRPRLADNKKQSIIRDVLIAVSAKQHAVTVVSDNEDFPLLQGYYKFRWQPGKEFFG